MGKSCESVAGLQQVETKPAAAHPTVRAVRETGSGGGFESVSSGGFDLAQQIGVTIQYLEERHQG